MYLFVVVFKICHIYLKLKMLINGAQQTTTKIGQYSLLEQIVLR